MPCSLHLDSTSPDQKVTNRRPGRNPGLYCGARWRVEGRDYRYQQCLRRVENNKAPSGLNRSRSRISQAILDSLGMDEKPVDGKYKTSSSPYEPDTYPSLSEEKEYLN